MAHSPSHSVLLVSVFLLCLLGGICARALRDAEKPDSATISASPSPQSTVTTLSSSPTTSAAASAAVVRSEREGVQEEDRCAFYCFFRPINDEKINISHYKNLTGCTHLVYGFAEIDSRNEIDHATSYDIIHGDHYGNYKLITSFRYALVNPMKMLYGVSVLSDADFVGRPEKHREVADEIVWWARHTRFNGIYLDVDKRSLNSPLFGEWMKALNESMEVDGKRFASRLSLVLAISASYIPTFYEKAHNYDSMVEAFYLIMDEITTGSSTNKAALVDPLYATPAISEQDTIQWVAEKFASGKIPKHKIIIGLTAWARSYALPVDSEHGGVSALRFGQPGNRTDREDGRLAYDELCHVRGFDPAHASYEASSCTTFFNDNQTTTGHAMASNWYSYNAPGHISLDRKLQWISGHGFSGIGLSSIQGDDLNGTCGEGPLPLHNSIAELFPCIKQYGSAGGHGRSAASGGPMSRQPTENEMRSINFNGDVNGPIVINNNDNEGDNNCCECSSSPPLPTYPADEDEEEEYCSCKTFAVSEPETGVTDEEKALVANHSLFLNESHMCQGRADGVYAFGLCSRYSYRCTMGGSIAEKCQLGQIFHHIDKRCVEPEEAPGCDAYWVRLGHVHMHNHSSWRSEGGAMETCEHVLPHVAETAKRLGDWVVNSAMLKCALEPTLLPLCLLLKGGYSEMTHYIGHNISPRNICGLLFHNRGGTNVRRNGGAKRCRLHKEHVDRTGLSNAFVDATISMLKTAPEDLHSVEQQNLKVDQLLPAARAVVDSITIANWMTSGHGAHQNEALYEGALLIEGNVRRAWYHKFGTEVSFCHVEGRRRVDAVMISADRRSAMIVEIKCDTGKNVLSEAMTQAKGYKELVTVYHREVEVVIFVAVNIIKGHQCVEMDVEYLKAELPPNYDLAPAFCTREKD